MFAVVVGEGAGGDEVPGEAGFGVEPELAGEEVFRAGGAEQGELEGMLADGGLVARHAVDGRDAAAGQQFGFAAQVHVEGGFFPVGQRQGCFERDAEVVHPVVAVVAAGQVPAVGLLGMVIAIGQAALNAQAWRDVVADGQAGLEGQVADRFKAGHFRDIVGVPGFFDGIGVKVVCVDPDGPEFIFSLGISHRHEVGRGLEPGFSRGEVARVEFGRKTAVPAGLCMLLGPFFGPDFCYRTGGRIVGYGDGIRCGCRFFGRDGFNDRFGDLFVFDGVISDRR